MAKPNEIMPITTPSAMTVRITARSSAPMARVIPISRVRSSTFMLIVPVNPIEPTIAVSTAMISRKTTSVSRLSTAMSNEALPASAECTL